MQRDFQYFLAFQLAKDASFHVVEHLHKALVHLFFFRSVRKKGVEKNERNVFQVTTAAETAKEAFGKACIAFGKNADGVMKVFIHEGKGGGRVEKRKVRVWCT